MPNNNHFNALRLQRWLRELGAWMVNQQKALVLCQGTTCL
jgi:hypothetical protein